MTADCVVSEGEAEADNCSGEECHEHGLEEGYHSAVALIGASLPSPGGQFL